MAVALELGVSKLGDTMLGPLDFSGSNNVGLKLSSLSSAQITSLSSPTNGSLVYNSDSNRVRGRVSGSWRNLITDDVLTSALSGLGSASTLVADTDVTLAANSDTRVATQKAVKTYIGNAVTGLLDFKGSTNASANPNYPAASKGDSYVVSVAGKIGGASGKAVDIGDVYLATADNAGGAEASVGTSWIVLEHNLQGALLSANNLSEVNPGTARSNLGLGDIATRSATEFLGVSNNLSDLSDPAVARGYLLLGTVATWDEVNLTDFLNGTYLSAANNLAELTDASAARTSLGLAIGTNVQAYDSELSALAGLTSAANKLPYFTGSGTASLADFTAAGRALIDDADAAAQRTTLGLGSAALNATGDFDAAGLAATVNSSLSTHAALTTSAHGGILASSGGTLTGALRFSGTTFAGLEANTLTTTQRDALTPVAGDIIWNGTTSRFEHYIGSAWKSFVRLDGDTMTGSLQLPSANTLNWNADTFLSRASAGVVNVGTTSSNALGTLQCATTIAGAGSASTPAVRINSENTGLYSVGTSQLGITCGSGAVARFISSGLHFSNSTTSFLGWYSDANYGTLQGAICLDAANTLAQRNGLNTQTFRLYNTFTDTSNYERGGLRFNNNHIELFAEGAGTGANRNVQLFAGSGADIVFIAGGTERSRVNSSGHFTCTSAGNYDFGTSSNPFRTGYFKTSLIQGGALNNGATAPDGLVLKNTTAAALGAQQWSPALRLSSQGWSTSLGASVQSDWAIYIRPNQSGSATVRGDLMFDAAPTTPGSYTNRLVLQSDGAMILTGNLQATGDINAGNGSLIYWNSRSVMFSPSDGIIRLSNNAQTDFTRLQFGGTTASFPALKRNATTLQVRLADDSADASISASNILTNLTTSTNAGAPAASTTYIIGHHGATTVANTTAGTRRMYIPFACTLTKVYGFFSQTAGSSETSTISIRLNNSSDTTIVSTLTNDAGKTTFSNAAMSLALAAGDYIEIKWVTPAWVTPPTSCYMAATIQLTPT